MRFFTQSSEPYGSALSTPLGAKLIAPNRGESQSESGLALNLQGRVGHFNRPSFVH